MRVREGRLRHTPLSECLEYAINAVTGRFANESFGLRAIRLRRESFRVSVRSFHERVVSRFANVL